MHAPADSRIEEWHPDFPGTPALDEDLGMLGEVLHAVVHTGAGVSFIVPFSLDDVATVSRAVTVNACPSDPGFVTRGA